MIIFILGLWTDVQKISDVIIIALILRKKLIANRRRLADTLFMALINASHETLADDQLKFWEDTLKNTRILFFELDKAIYALTQDEKKSYSMDTGQNTINVTVHDLPALIDRREKLKKQIEELEEKLGVTQIEEPPKIFQGNPAW